MNGLGVVFETARRAKGLTQGELANAADITQAALSRYENDLREPEEEILGRLADALDVTPSFLTQAGKVRGAVAVEAHMRRRKTARTADWRRLEARLNMHRLHARRVFDEIALRAEQRIPTFDPVDTQASDAARFVRMQWRMPSGPVRHLTQWLESAGCVLIEEHFGTTRVDGLSQWIDELPIILLNATAPTDRKRLTIAHELGHLALHTQEIGDDVEREATHFSAEFLMPIQVIRPQLRNLTMGRLLDLKLEWGVSIQALIERAWDIKAITASHRATLYKVLSARGWRTQEPNGDELAPEHPALAQAVGAAFAARGFTSAEIASVVGYRSPDGNRPFIAASSRLRVVT